MPVAENVITPNLDTRTRDGTTIRWWSDFHIMALEQAYRQALPLPACAQRARGRLEALDDRPVREPWCRTPYERDIGPTPDGVMLRLPGTGVKVGGITFSATGVASQGR